MRIIVVFLSLIVLNVFPQKAFRQGKWFGFEQNGDVIIEPDYEYAADFSEGFACVKKYGKWGFINGQNDWLVEPTYDKVSPFKNGFAKVAKSGKVGLINVSGSLVLKPIYDEINYTYGSWIELVKSGKKGLYQFEFSGIPCEYESVGMNENGVGYGKKKSGLYDVFDDKGLILKDQEHSFSSWNVKENLAVAVKDGKYGLYNISLGGWSIDPQYVHIQSLYTESYSEINEFGEPTDYTFVYALFSEVGEINYSIRKKTNGANKLSILKAGSLNTLENNLIGYEQTEEGEGYNRTYDYILTYADGSKKMLNTILGITQGLDWGDEVEFRGARIVKDNGVTSLYFGEDLQIRAESILPLTVVEEYKDLAGNVAVKEILLDIPYLVVKQSDGVALYDADRGKFILDNLPSNTIFKLEQGEELLDFKLTYSADGKMGMLTNRLKPTKMIYQDVVDFEHLPFLKVKQDGVYHLLDKKDRDHVLVSGDEIELFNLSNNYVFLVEKGGKLSFYNPKTKKLLGSYDEVERKESFESTVITRVGDLYGLHDTHEELVLVPQVKDKSIFFKREIYPFFFYEKNGKYIGIDGYTYECLDSHELDYDKKDRVRLGFYDCKNDGEFKPVNNAVFKGGDVEFYPYFHVKGMNNKMGIINHMGDTLVPFEYKDFWHADVGEGWINYYDDEILLALTKKGIGLLSVREGELVAPEYSYIEIDYDYLNYETQAAWLYKKKKVGLYVHGSGVVYPAIYKGIHHTYEFIEWDTDTLMLETSKGKWGLGNINGEVILPTIYDDIRTFQFEYTYPYKWNHVLEVEMGKKVGLYLPQKGSMIIEPLYDDIDEMIRVEDYTYDTEGELYAYIVHQKDKIGAYDYHGNNLLPAKFDEIKLYPYDNYHADRPVVVWGELEGKVYVNINDPRNPDKAFEFNDSIYFDKVFGYSAYKFSGDEITRMNFLTGEETKHQSEVTIEGIGYDILFRNGKYGAVDKEGNVLIEPTYDSGDFMHHRESEVMIGYENGVKYYIYVFNNQRYTEGEW